RHREMYQFAGPHRTNPPGWALAVGTFVADRALRTAERGWRSAHARGLRLAAAATAATPLLLGLALGRRALALVGADPLGAVVRTLYSQDALAATLESPGPRSTGPGPRPADYDVLVVGGGPGGSSAATFGWPWPSARPSRASTWGSRSCPPTCRCWTAWACWTR